jgi:MOSC domain-containing protein YiiM
MTERKQPMIVSINVGRPKEIPYLKGTVETAIGKHSMQGPLRLNKLNFEGDQQADLIHHGGANKAVCVYSEDHFPYWETQLERTIGAGAFGENLTIRGGAETDFCIGDTYRIGTALVQVSQPRHPCFKLAAKHGVKDLPAQVLQTGYTGFYLRVLEEGVVSAGDTMIPVKTSHGSFSIAEVNRITFGSSSSPDELHQLLQVASLAEEWKAHLYKRLKTLE